MQYKVTDGQKRIYILTEILKSGAYNVPIAYKFNQPLNVQKLKDALLALADKHEILRTCYEVLDGEIFAVVHEVDTVHVHEQKIREADFEKAFRNFYSCEIPLTKAPVFHAAVFYAETYFYFVIVYHHICVDAWSQNIIVEDLMRFYFDTPSTTASDASGYDQHALEFQQYLQSPKYQQSKTYWAQKIESIPTPHIPFKRSRNNGHFHCTGQRYFAYIDDGRSGIASLIKKHRITKFNFLLTVWDITLHLLYKKQFAVGNMVANRVNPQFFRTVGFFANFIIHKSDISVDDSFHDILLRVQKDSLYSLAHSEFPISDLLDHQALTQRSSNTFFNVFVNYNNTNTLKIRQLGDLQQILAPYDERVHTFDKSKFDLTLFINDQEDQITRLAFEFRSDIAVAEITRIQNCYCALIQHFASDEVWQSKVSDVERTHANLLDVESDDIETEMFSMIQMEIAEDVEIDYTADFFLSGGNSFKLFKLINIVKRRYGIDEIPLTDFFTEPSIANLVSQFCKQIQAKEKLSPLSVY